MSCPRIREVYTYEMRYHLLPICRYVCNGLQDQFLPLLTLSRAVVIVERAYAPE